MNASETKKPWWQNDFDGGKPDIKLSDLTDGADAVVAKRMVKGFYVAVDRSFGWHGRTWYRTTASLVAPADRFAVNKPPTFAGIRLAAEGAEAVDPKLPTAFVLSTRAVEIQGRSREAHCGCVGAGQPLHHRAPHGQGRPSRHHRLPRDDRRMVDEGDRWHVHRSWPGSRGALAR